MYQRRKREVKNAFSGQKRKRSPGLKTPTVSGVKEKKVRRRTRKKIKTTDVIVSQLNVYAKVVKALNNAIEFERSNSKNDQSNIFLNNPL